MALEAVLYTYLLIITNRVLSHGKKIVKKLSKFIKKPSKNEVL